MAIVTNDFEILYQSQGCMWRVQERGSLLQSLSCTKRKGYASYTSRYQHGRICSVGRRSGPMAHFWHLRSSIPAFEEFHARTYCLQSLSYLKRKDVRPTYSRYQHGHNCSVGRRSGPLAPFWNLPSSMPGLCDPKPIKQKWIKATIAPRGFGEPRRRDSHFINLITKLGLSDMYGHSNKASETWPASKVSWNPLAPFHCVCK